MPPQVVEVGLDSGRPLAELDVPQWCQLPALSSWNNSHRPGRAESGTQPEPRARTAPSKDWRSSKAVANCDVTPADGPGYLGRLSSSAQSSWPSPTRRQPPGGSAITRPRCRAPVAALLPPPSSPATPNRCAPPPP